MASPVNLDPKSQPVQPAAVRNQPARPAPAAGAPSFASALQKAQGLQFSNHAQKRLETRQIALSDDSLTRLEAAVDKAGQRGGRESLILVDDLAFIVNVKDRLVVTAMDTHSRKEGVFTQIDSVVFADAHEM